MKNATEARKQATSVSNTTTAAALEAIGKKIDEAVSRGDCSTRISWLGNVNVRKALEDLGYKVENFDDQRERESWTTVSW